MDSIARPIANFGVIERRATLAAVAVVIVLAFGIALAIRADSHRRVADIQAALSAKGLGAARIEPVLKRVYVCKHAYVWRTASRNGSACTDSFSSRVVIYDAGQQPLVKCWEKSDTVGWRLRPCPAS
ncbi:MAG: hypothetical protein ACJ798_11370 [Phenylobacterium sp.]